MHRWITSVALISLLAGCSEQAGSLFGMKEKKPEPGTFTVKAPPKVITTESLLDDMVELSRLMELSGPAYKTLQASSYDRASKSPDNHDAWFANKDWGQWIRIEEKEGRREGVMMEADGPGVIVRIWSANPDKAGKIRIYIDGSAKPAIETEMETLLGGRYPGLASPLAGRRAAGWNLHFPIPYARHCKVTSDGGEFYYHVNYRTYAPETQLESFRPEQIQQLSARIQEVAGRLGDPRLGSNPPADRKREPFEATLSPEKQLIVSNLEGPRAICGLLFHIMASDLTAAARQTVLRISFDGEHAVECPLGDFYGSAALVPYDSYALGVTEKKPQDLWCHWWMPFEKNAKISVRNLGSQTVQLTGAVATVPYDWNDRSLHFHAKWRIERDIPALPKTDWAHLEAQGEGRFVGGALHITNFVRDWWGEGDEKIYVDGESFPSHFGTGTEDYYGYAWCSQERFVHAYHAQPMCQGPGNYGNTYVSRFHIIDDIPFTKSFKFDLENWHGSQKETSRTTRAAVSYWYARPGGRDFFKEITRDDVRIVPMPAYTVPKVKGAIEGETLQVLEKTGVAERQELGEEHSGATHLWWREGKPGDKLVLGFDAPEAGRRNVVVRLTGAPDYAKVQLYINGQKAGPERDLYRENVRALREMDLGAFDLKKGQNTLTAEIVGASEKAIKSYMFGIDYILLK